MRTSTYLWSLRRELWEYRSIWMAPLIVGAVAFVGFLVTVPRLPGWVADLRGPDVEMAHNFVHGPYGVAAMAGFATAFLVGVFYSLDALYGERRDRGVLFWKSLPVSDRTTVLAKASIPLLVLPLVTFAVTAVVIALVALVSVAVLHDRASIGLLFMHVQPARSTLAALWAVIAIAIWHAPIYGWLLLVSGWARRMALLWAVVPLLAIGMIERILFQTWDFFLFLQHLLLGWATTAFAFHDDAMTDLLGSLTPLRLLGTPSVWIGLAFTAACVAGATHLRRRSEPI